MKYSDYIGQKLKPEAYTTSSPSSRTFMPEAYTTSIPTNRACKNKLAGVYLLVYLFIYLFIYLFYNLLIYLFIVLFTVLIICYLHRPYANLSYPNEHVFLFHFI